MDTDQACNNGGPVEGFGGQCFAGEGTARVASLDGCERDRITLRVRFRNTDR